MAGDKQAPYIPQVRMFRDWLRANRGLDFKDYDELWRWSVTDLEAYWQAVWDCYGIHSPTPHSSVLAENKMPGARWFEGARVNYAQQVLRHVQPAHAAGFAAILSHDEESLAAGRPAREMSWPDWTRS